MWKKMTALGLVTLVLITVAGCSFHFRHRYNGEFDAESENRETFEETVDSILRIRADDIWIRLEAQDKKEQKIRINKNPEIHEVSTKFEGGETIIEVEAKQNARQGKEPLLVQVPDHLIENISIDMDRCFGEIQVGSEIAEEIDIECTDSFAFVNSASDFYDIGIDAKFLQSFVAGPGGIRGGIQTGDTALSQEGSLANIIVNAKNSCVIFDVETDLSFDPSQWRNAMKDFLENMDAEMFCPITFGLEYMEATFEENANIYLGTKEEGIWDREEILMHNKASWAAAERCV